ncbi:putative esterase [Handroanthus impetiginosus]|uniref:Putative esterase n=1 Tax=Handroanthus impetiginosus TaxID=429701 RepID=A0A2G9GCM3_9LAMI|nr:putative esterase [Handroanthus impetiginosus]
MQQKVTILNKRGEKIVGVLHESGSTDIVVLCHGFRSSKDNSTMVNLAAALENEGISAFRFDFSGNGESEGAFQYGNYSSEAEDLRALFLFVFSVYLGIYFRLVGMTCNRGGNVVLLYASKYHDIGAVVNVSGRYDLKRGIKERLGEKFLERLKKDGYIDVKTRTGDYQVTEESLMERLNTNMHEACLSIDGRCRVLTVHGSADEIIPVEDAHEFAKIIPNHQLQIIEGADHHYSSHQDELASAVLRFIKECLQQHSEDISK